MSGKYKFYDSAGRELTEEEALTRDGMLKDGVSVRTSVYLVDSNGNTLVDGFGAPLPTGGGYGRTGWAFADHDRTIAAENRDLHRAEISATYRGGLEAGDLVQLNGRMMQVRGYDSEDKIHLSDATQADGDELKQNAYDAMTRELSNAWRGKAVAGDEEGGACVINGSPGKWTKGPDGKLVCVPISREPSENEWAIAGSLSDQSVNADTIRRAAWEQSCRDLQDAWKTRRYDHLSPNVNTSVT